MFDGPEEQKILAEIQTTIASIQVDLASMIANCNRIINRPPCFQPRKIVPVGVNEPSLSMAVIRNVHDEPANKEDDSLSETQTCELGLGTTEVADPLSTKKEEQSMYLWEESLSMRVPLRFVDEKFVYEEHKSRSIEPQFRYHPLRDTQKMFDQMPDKDISGFLLSKLKENEFSSFNTMFGPQTYVSLTQRVRWRVRCYQYVDVMLVADHRLLLYERAWPNWYIEGMVSQRSPLVEDVLMIFLGKSLSLLEDNCLTYLPGQQSAVLVVKEPKRNPPDMAHTFTNSNATNHGVCAVWQYLCRSMQNVESIIFSTTCVIGVAGLNIDHLNSVDAHDSVILLKRILNTLDTSTVLATSQMVSGISELLGMYGVKQGIKWLIAFIQRHSQDTSLWLKVTSLEALSDPMVLPFRAEKRSRTAMINKRRVTDIVLVHVSTWTTTAAVTGITHFRFHWQSSKMLKAYTSTVQRTFNILDTNRLWATVQSLLACFYLVGDVSDLQAGIKRIVAFNQEFIQANMALVSGYSGVIKVQPLSHSIGKQRDAIKFSVVYSICYYIIQYCSRFRNFCLYSKDIDIIVVPDIRCCAPSITPWNYRVLLQVTLHCCSLADQCSDVELIPPNIASWMMHTGSLGHS